MSSNKKILHLPNNNGNHPWTLSRAERKLGFKSDLAVFYKHPFYGGNYDYCLDIEYLSIPNEYRRIKALGKFIKEYDIFHFNFAQSLLDHPFWGLNYLDFPILKKAGKKIFVTFQGDDARQKKYFLEHYGDGPYESQNYSLGDRYFDLMKKYRINRVDKYADGIFALNPDIMNVLPKRTKFLPYASLNFQNVKPEYKSKNKKIRILHAPSERCKKGTDIIIETVKKISSENDLEFILLENKPFSEIWKEYQKADIIIDQIVIGWYGGMAVESMALGKPVIAYLNNDDLKKFIPFRNEIPIINADKDTLEEAILVLIRNQKLREKIGIRSRKYVEKYHDPIKIASQTLGEYFK